jgi:hypothetical protein
VPVFGKPRTSHTGDRPLDRRAPNNKTGARTLQTNTRPRGPYYPLLRTAVDYKRKKCLGCIVAMVPGPKGPRVQVSSRSSPRVQEYKGPIVRLSNDQCFQLELVETLKSPRVQEYKGPRVQEYKGPRPHTSKRSRVQGSQSTRVHVLNCTNSQ